MEYRRRPMAIQGYIGALAAMVAITVVMSFIDPPLDHADIMLLYVLVVFVLAMTVGLGPSVVASVGGFLAFNFFFVPPLYTFHVHRSQDALRLLTFLVVAVSTSGLAARARSQAEAVQRAADRTQALYELSQSISAQVDLDRILPVIAETTCRLLRLPGCAVLLYDAEGRLYEHCLFGHFGVGLRTMHAFMRDGATVLGVLRVSERQSGVGLDDDEQQLLHMLAAQARLALDRARLVSQAAHAQALAESDRLKSALISSVSHDLRTPLAVIKGAASTLLVDGVMWGEETQRVLAQTIEGEADHLNRIVCNLLDMSRIEAGALRLEVDWHDLAEVLGALLRRMERRLQTHPIAVALPADLPLIPANAMLIEQVFANLLENALMYTPDGTPISISARQDGAAVVVVVADEGPGIPAEQREQVFTKFYRGTTAAGKPSGSGLGLAICKGIVEAHGGRIWVEPRSGGGVAFVFRLPAPEPSQEEK